MCEMQKGIDLIRKFEKIFFTININKLMNTEKI